MPLSLRLPVPSIRAALFASMLALVAFATAALGWRAAEDWHELQAARAAQVANQGANRFISGLFEVLMERLATNNALQAADPAPPAVLAEIERRRQAVAANFIPGRAVLGTLAFPGRDSLLRDLDAALAKADALRRQADAAIRQPVTARDAALRQDFIPGLTASVNAALGVWFAAVHTVAAADPVLARLAVVKEIGWRLRDTAGFERSNVAAAIAARQPVADDKLAANAAIRGRVDLLWSQLGNLAPADPATDPAIRRAMATAQREYFEGFRGLADRMAQAGAAPPGGQYPMATQAFVETTTEQLGTLLGIMHAAAAASEVRAEAIVASRELDLHAALGLLSAGFVVAGLASWVVLGRVTRPLGALEAATVRLAAGDLTVEVPGSDRRDEVGRLASAICVLHEGMTEKARLQAAQTSEAARTTADKRAVVQRMADQVEEAARVAVARIKAGGSTITVDAGALAETARDVARSAGLVTDTAAQVLADTEAGAAATEQLAASIREVAMQVEGATAAARRAVDRTTSSQTAIGGLTVAAGRISEVVQLIADIAGRTNLLALNATIEAARAGEAGKGFAVVASEVKALASQTARATEEISRQVQEIGAATRGAVAAVGEIAEAIGETDAAAGAIAQVIDQQAKATAEIAETVARTATAAREVSQRIAEVSVSVAGAGARADAVRTAATEAEEATATLQTTIVAIIRTATPEADRRGAERFPGQDRRITLEAGAGVTLPGRLADISAGGAAVLLPAGTAVPPEGATVTLRVDGFSLPLPGNLLMVTPEPGDEGLRLRVRFQAPEAAALALAPLLRDPLRDPMCDPGTTQAAA